MKKILKFLNVVDREGNLSITNIAVIVLLTKIAIAPDMDWPTVGALLASMMNYMNKRTNTIEFKK